MVNEFSERFRSRACAHRKVALNSQSEAIKIGAQDFRFFNVWDSPDPESPAAPSLLEGDLFSDFRVTDPLSASSAGNEQTPTFEFQHVDWRGVHAASLPTPHLQQIVMAQAEPETHDNAEGSIEHPFKPARLPESWCRLVHGGFRAK